VLEIVEVIGYEDGEITTKPIYEFVEKGDKDGRVIGELKRVNDLTHTKKLKAGGLE
jgi:pilus assembly protein CpaF